MNKQEKLINELAEEIAFLEEDFKDCSSNKMLEIQVKIETLDFCIKKIKRIFNEENTEISSITDDTDSFITPINRNNSDSSSTHTQRTHSDEEVARNDVSPVPPTRKPSSIN